MTKRLDVKIILAVVFTVLIPLGFSVYLVDKAVNTSLGLGVNDEILEQIENALAARRDLIAQLKKNASLSFRRIIDSHELKQAALLADRSAVEAALRSLQMENPSIVELSLIPEDNAPISIAAPHNPNVALRTVTKKAPYDVPGYKGLEVVLGVDAGIFDEYGAAGAAAGTYRALVEAPPSYLNDRFLVVYLAILAGSVALSIMIGVFWARRLAMRIHRLSRATRSVAEGDMSVRVDPGARDEVGRLVDSFNGMVGELAVNRARIEYLQKISAWQEMARRLAHEIKNPLTPIQLAAQQLKTKYSGDDPAFGRLLAQSAEIIEEEVQTLRRLTSDFSQFAKLPAVRPEPVDISEFFAECEASLAPVAQQDGVELVFQITSRHTTALIDRIMMKRVIDNLVRNATEALLDSAVPRPRIVVSVDERLEKGLRHAVIRVEDNGPGIGPDLRASIFDPYYTTKTEGTGLGLAISKKIVLEHAGRIWLDEGRDKGAAFVVVLPSAPPISKHAKEKR